MRKQAAHGGGFFFAHFIYIEPVPSYTKLTGHMQHVKTIFEELFCAFVIKPSLATLTVRMGQPSYEKMTGDFDFASLFCVFVLFYFAPPLIIFLHLLNPSFTLSLMNLLNAIELDSVASGKPLTNPEKNLIAKLESFGVIPAPHNPDGSPLYRRNPFGGGCEVTPAAAALYDFCMESYRGYERNFSFAYRGHKFPIATYDRTRYLVLKLWPDVYMTLLD